MNRRCAAALAGVFALACADTTPAPSPLAPPLARAAKDPSSTTEKVNDRYDAVFLATNPCNGETVLVLGRFHVHGTIATSGSGVEEDLREHSQVMHGTGLVTGASYTYHERTRTESSVVFDPAGESFTLTASYDVVSQGSTDNWHADFAFRVSSPPPRVELLRDEARCTG